MRNVLCGEGSQEPSVALEWYLATYPPSLDDPIRLLFGVRRTTPLLPDPLPPGLTVATFMPGRGLRNVNAEPLLMPYSEVCDALARGPLRPDVLIACAGPVGPDGHRSLGGINGWLQIALNSAAVVVLEELEWLPHIHGAAVASRWDAIVAGPVARPSTPLAGDPDEIDRAVASEVFSLIVDSSALALGVGRVADALTERLTTRRGLRVVTGAVTEGVRSLYSAGALDPDYDIRAMSVIGDVELLRWAASAPVRLLPSTTIHDSEWLRGNSGLVAVLGGLTLDDQANLNGHRIRGRFVSGPGGAPDFAAGAHASSGGLTIAALRSRAPDGRSSLVSQSEAITVPGSSVDAVATENGSVLLAGLSFEGRRRAIRDLF